MTVIHLIAAVDEHNGMGKNNQLLCHLPRDLAHFKALTLGKPLLMGRKTFESIGKPLPHRINLVLTKQDWSAPGVLVVRSIAEALSVLQDVEEVMVIGGAEVYTKVLDMAEKIYLTRIHHVFSADTFFPALSEEVWFCKEAEMFLADEKNAYAMTFQTFVRRV